jgi:hypothetical protein
MITGIVFHNHITSLLASINGIKLAAGNKTGEVSC